MWSRCLLNLINFRCVECECLECSCWMWCMILAWIWSRCLLNLINFHVLNANVIVECDRYPWMWSNLNSWILHHLAFHTFWALFWDFEHFLAIFASTFLGFYERNRERPRPRPNIPSHDIASLHFLTNKFITGHTLISFNKLGPNGAISDSSIVKNLSSATFDEFQSVWWKQIIGLKHYRF